MPSQPKKSRLDELYAEVAEASQVVEEAAEAKKQLAVTKAEIAAEQERLSVISTQVKHASTDYDKQVATQAEELLQLKSEADHSHQEQRELDKKIMAASQLLAESKTSLSNIKIAISDAQIKRDTLGRDNSRILENYQKLQLEEEAKIIEMQNKVNDLDAKIAILTHTYKVNLDRVATQQQELTDQTTIYKQKAQQYKLDLGSLEIEIANKQTLLASFDAQMSKRKVEIEAQEESVKLQRGALAQAAQDLNAAKRKFDSDKAIYGV